MVLAIGAGSLMLSHVNDGGFWLFKEYFNLSVKDTLSTWTVMETTVGGDGINWRFNYEYTCRQRAKGLGNSIIILTINNNGSIGTS